jgi:hypothetical protein
VNRPFSAFATLMTLLGLAMFAVSSTDRSTTVKPAVRVQGSGYHRDSGRRWVQQGALEVSDWKADVGKKQFTRKSRDKSVAETASAPLRRLSIRNNSQQPTLQPAQIAVAKNSPARVGTGSTIDCRSYYDPTYDLVIYGVRDSAVEMPLEAASPAATANLAGELDVIFHELASRQAERPLPQAGAMNVERTTLRWKAIAAAVGSWWKYHAGRVIDSQSALCVDWAEYTEFADSVMPPSVATADAAGISDASRSVRSGGWLRHSAASSFHQLSLMLEAVATELNETDRPALSAVAK